MTQTKLQEEYREQRRILIDDVARHLEGRNVETVFDVACGRGHHLVRLCSALECAGVGVDITPQMVRAAEGLEHEADIVWRNTDYREWLPEQDGYDFILCMGLLYYYEDFESVIRLIAEHARVGFLVDTFCLDLEDESQNVLTLDNPSNRMTEWAGLCGTA